MKVPYEILHRFDIAVPGAYKGGHTIRFDTDTRQIDPPLPIGVDKDFPWPKEAELINQSIAARVSELEALVSDGNEQRLKLQKESETALAVLQSEFDAYKVSAKAESDKALADLTTKLGEAQKALADKNAQVTSGIATIQSIVADPDTNTEKGIIAFLYEATKDERTKQREALVNQKSEIDKQLAELV